MSSIYIVIIASSVSAIAIIGYIKYNEYKKSKEYNDVEKNLPINLTPKVSQV